MQEEVSTMTFRLFPEGMELGGGPVSRRLEQAELDQVLARVIGGLEERKQAVELGPIRAQNGKTARHIVQTAEQIVAVLVVRIGVRSAPVSRRAAGRR